MHTYLYTHFICSQFFLPMLNFLSVLLGLVCLSGVYRLWLSLRLVVVGFGNILNIHNLLGL